MIDILFFFLSGLNSIFCVKILLHFLIRNSSLIICRCFFFTVFNCSIMGFVTDLFFLIKLLFLKILFFGISVLRILSSLNDLFLDYIEVHIKDKKPYFFIYQIYHSLICHFLQFYYNKRF